MSNSHLLNCWMSSVVWFLFFWVVSELNLVKIKGTNSPKCLVNGLGRFVGFGDEKVV